MITIAALMSGGNFEQLRSHIALGKEHGITQEEIREIITHLAFYCGCPKAWSAFNIAKKIYGMERTSPPARPSQIETPMRRTTT